ncbi:NAD(P)/FAD-dependent oxidoreductase [Paraburkholderia sp. ZP32-5]|uniref:NAD(P)/FAD-dependent oxidoreductase n=1 Tax=Paraburkholderia sp. ZP32-5 TaxID=2883245 RepID=UPI001F25E939|nr:FAD-binding oxidoreductase [Paraburkholderia sp. ZP32-5]
MQRRVVVIGGGVVGLSCAFYARREGFDVTIVDPGVAEGRASFGNAGVLAFCEQLPLATPELIRELPRLLLSRESPLTVRWRYFPALLPWLIRFALSSSSASVHRAMQGLHALMSGALAAHQDIAHACGTADMLTHTGWIKAWQKAPSRTGSSERDMLADLGIGMRELSSAELADLAPGFDGVFEAATLFSDCYHVSSPGRYIASIAAQCQASGVRFVDGVVSEFRQERGAVRGVLTEAGSRIDADDFIVAGGAWSKRLAAALGDTVPLDTERGYHLMLDVGAAPVLRAPLLWQEKSIVLSQMEDGLRMTSSVEFAGLHALPRYEKIERTLAAVRNTVPSLADARINSRWLGFRPSVPDSVPVIGRSAQHRNCLFAFGHGHLGLTLGPVTGKLIATQLADRPAPIDLGAFSPARFN